MTRKTQVQLVVAAAALAAAMLAYANIGVVKKVHSGDLVQFGDTFLARLTGIRTPAHGEPLGDEVYEFTKRELEGRTVRLFTWTTDNTAAGIVYDENGYARVQIYYGRLSGEKADAASFNEVLLKKGYARVDPKFLPDDLSYYYDLEKEAREKGLGIWKKNSSAPGLSK